MNTKSLYSLTGMKRKHSIMKSVFITGEKTYEGFPLVTVEAYDQTFLNAINTISKYDNTVDRILKAVYDYYNGEDAWVSIYTDEHGQIEILISEHHMRQYGLLE